MMKRPHFVIALALLASISMVKTAVADSEFLLEEGSDAPETIWDSDVIGENWQIIPENNSTVLGTFELNDSVDLYAIEISSSNWTMIGFSVSGNDSVSISLQRLNQSSWSIAEYANEEIGEISLDQGFHAIRLERLGSFDEEIEYRFTIRNMGTFDETEEYVNLAWMFTPFYVFAGIFLIFPLLVVIWWNRAKLLPFGKSYGELEESEVQVLGLLRERFSMNGENLDLEEINAALSTLGRNSWEVISEELGDPEIRHFTENIDICAWRVKESSNSLLIGIKTGSSSWEMAAIRIHSPMGESIKISSVVPEMMFQDDEVYLGNLVEGSTTLIRLETLGRAPETKIHISGLVEGKPIAAVPTKSIGIGEE